MEKEASTNMKTFPAYIKIPTGYAPLRGEKPMRAGDIVLDANYHGQGLRWIEVDAAWNGVTPAQADRIACFKLKPKKTL